MRGGVPGMTYAYRVAPSGAVMRVAATAPSLRDACPATIFAASGYVWAISNVAFGHDVGKSYLLRIDEKGTVEQVAIAGPRGAIGAGPSIAGRSGTVFLSSDARGVPVLRYAS